MFNKTISRFSLEVASIKKSMLKLKDDTRGAEFVQILIAVLIVIIIGGIAVGILRIAAPELINDVVDRIRNVFEL